MSHHVYVHVPRHCRLPASSELHDSSKMRQDVCSLLRTASLPTRLPADACSVHAAPLSCVCIGLHLSQIRDITTNPEWMQQYEFEIPVMVCVRRMPDGSAEEVRSTVATGWTWLSVWAACAAVHEGANWCHLRLVKDAFCCRVCHGNAGYRFNPCTASSCRWSFQDSPLEYPQTG